MALGIRLLVCGGSGSAAMALEVPILLVVFAGAPVSRKSHRMLGDDFPLSEALCKKAFECADSFLVFLCFLVYCGLYLSGHF